MLEGDVVDTEKYWSGQQNMNALYKSTRPFYWTKKHWSLLGAGKTKAPQARKKKKNNAEMASLLCALVYISVTVY